MTRSGSAFALTLLALALSASPADAQLPRPERPYRGLFGGGSGSGDAEQSLIFNASLGGGYDDSLAADFTGRERPRVSDLNQSHSGTLGNATGSLSYGLSLDAVTIGASAGASVRYYPSLDDEIMTRKNASLSASARVVRDVSVFGSATYSPYTMSSLYPGLFETGDAAAPFDPNDFGSSVEHFIAYSGGATYERQVSRRMSIDANYAHRRSSSSVATSFSADSAGGGLTYNVGRGLDLRAGYDWGQARYSTGSNRPTRHNIDAGLDFNRSLSFSRRTTVSFSTGTSAVAVPAQEGSRLRFRASGSANLNHEMGRTWSVDLGYNRGVRFVADWPEPVSSDAVSLALAGLPTRRVQANLNVRTATGNIGLGGGASGFRTYQGSAGLNYALSQFINLGISYSYYQHRFDQAAPLAPGFTNRLERNSVMASVSLWSPIFQRARRP